MSRIVAIKEAHESEGSRNVWEVGDAHGAPKWIKEKFDEVLKCEIARFEDEGHRITATILAEAQNGESERFYIHYPVGNLQDIVYVEADE